MRTNSIGRIRKDLDDVAVRQTKLERKMNIVICSIIIVGVCAAINLFL